MATLTPTRPSRPAARPTGGARDTGNPLAHPLADVWLVIGPALVLIGLGVLMVWSASTVFAYTQFGDSFYFLKRHLAFLAVALVAGWVTSRMPTGQMRAWAWGIYLFAGVTLVLTFTPLGYGVGGNKNWLDLGGPGNMLRFQPAEIAKLAIVVWGSAVLANKRKLLGEPKHLLVPFLPFSLLLVALVLLQGDLGTALILFALVMAVLWCVGASWPVLGGIGVAVTLGVVGLVATNANRLQRILGFLDPTTGQTGVNHQPQQALYGLATGGWGGVGLGRSRQKWGSLSEAHTDYVLAIIGEELGLIGTLSVLALFLVLGFGGARIAMRSSTFFGRLVAAGATTWFMLQALVNVMVVLRMLPVLGVPLPFLSYGGSALLVNVAVLGILVACAREEPAAQKWLARRRRGQRPRRRLSAVLPARSS